MPAGRERTKSLVAQNGILLQFYLDPEKIAQTYDPSWNPSAATGKRWGVSRSRREKLLNLYLWFDDSLWMPMRLRLDGTDLFHCGGGPHRRIEAVHGPGAPRFEQGHDLCPWDRLPVIVAAKVGWFALRNALHEGESGFMMADQGAIVFRVQGQLVEVSFRAWYESPENYSLDAIQAVVEYDELFTKWELFSEQVRTQFLEVLPELAENVQYGDWFRGGLDYLRRQPR